MKNTIDISIVMSVYNGEQTLSRTIESILSQEHTSFEFIIVDDGSTDKSKAIIESYAHNDTRVKLISHANIGLTRSLSVGCGQAQGRYIARQDCGDISLEMRLKKQFNLFERQKNVSMISCDTAFVTPNDEHLYTTSQSEDEALNGLKILDIKKIQGPSHHGSVMFRTSTYQLVGGYRQEFVVAQDIDLWMRMVEYGEHITLNETLYQATVEKNSISSTKREQQFKAAELIIQCRQARMNGSSERVILDKMKVYSSLTPKESNNTKLSNSNYYYFLGSSLMKTQPYASKQYFLDSIKENPFNWRAYIKYLSVLLVNSKPPASR